MNHSEIEKVEKEVNRSEVRKDTEAFPLQFSENPLTL
jgi:hypothetical protein